MKIKPINYSYINKNQLRVQNFNGLWGKTSRCTDYDSALGVPKTEDTYYYYPFRDESADDVKKIQANNTKAYIENSDKYRMNNCKICITLPFTADMYNEYSSITNPSQITDAARLIHAYVKNMYTNNDFGNEQHAAVNDKVSEFIKNFCK